MHAIADRPPFVYAVKSLLELIPFLFFIPGVRVFMSERLSPDLLERFFGCQRQRGATHKSLSDPLSPLQQDCVATDAGLYPGIQ